jgi:hypothetical protein
MTVTVAPREVVDQVHRASRSHGCDPDLADRLATEIAFCEIHHGGGIAAWVSLVDAAHGPFRLAAAEVVARSTGSAHLTFDPPLPLAVIARSLRDLERRGVRCTPGVDSAAVLTGTDPVPSLELALGEPVRAGTSRSDGASEAAYHDGLPVDRTLWQRLSDAAADFLVSEATLDAALEPTSR